MKPISETTIEVGGKAPRQETSKLSKITKDLIKKQHQMKATSSRDKAEFAELSNLITKMKVDDTRNY